MAVILIAIVLLAVVYTVSRTARNRRRHQPPSAADYQQVPTFQVVTIGLQGSGKTLLLASMYHQLQTPAHQCFFLTAPRDEVLLLNRWFHQMADTESAHGWPRGTAKGETRHFTFTVKTRTGPATHTAFHIRYLEYAGELLTEIQEPGSTAQEELEEHIRTADSLLGVVDGYVLRKVCDGDPGGRRRLARALDAMVPLMITATCPVSFVITKWDLLADLHPDERERMRIVREVLMANAQFSSLVRIHSDDRVVRLIPVSAVGPDFATVDPSGEVVKAGRGEVRPAHVEVPLSAVVPDMFDVVEHRLDETTRRLLREEVRRRSRMTPVEALASLGTFAGQVAGRALTLAFGTTTALLVSNSLMDLYMDSQSGAQSSRQARAEQELDGEQAKIEEFRRARRRVVDDMRRKVNTLEVQLPASRLTP
ncbi:hypothetical protein [Streptomyces flavalbus]|uniref:Uncharacterized protein n=1 Tax=Streptomyces flavalbus TaxID=2665155 RepID=A0ABW2WCA6_9ACTN